MKSLSLMMMLAFVLTSCATFDKMIGVSDAILNMPAAREELESYLTPDELETVRSDLALLDRTYEPIAAAVWGEVDISLEGALNEAFKAQVNRLDLEQAWSQIKVLVLRHQVETGEPIPVNLVRVSGEVESLYSSWDAVAATNQRAQAYLRVAGQLALAL